MAKTSSKKIWHKIKPKLLSASLLVILLVLIFITYQAVISDKYYPITFVGDTNISLLSRTDAIKKIETSFSKRAQQKIYFNYPQDLISIDLATASVNIDYSAIDEVFIAQHRGTYLEKLALQIQTLVLPQRPTPAVELNIENQLTYIATRIEEASESAQLFYDETTLSEGSTSTGSTEFTPSGVEGLTTDSLSASPSANIQIREGRNGLALDREALEASVTDYLVFGKYQMNLPVKKVSPKITTDHVMRAKKALESLQKESMKLRFEGNLWVIDVKQLLALLDLTTGENLLLDKDKTYEYISKIANQIDSQVQEGLFEFNSDTKRVTAFKPSREGRKLDREKTYNLVTDALLSRSSKTVNLPVEIIKPKIQTSDVNSLGIKELLGRGISHFAGSIPNRIYNINLTASKISGVLIPPGEIFSFNRTVGDITAATGFKQAYVIKSGRTVLDDGGGVCQDSTTLFRAALNAGLPVIKRTAHAYRVGYYEQGFPPGLDATVFYPSVDFQFKNDTPAHILIQAYTAGNTLYVDLYGTSDGRVASVSKSSVTDQTPPPPELRQDDPTLPKGEVKQVDWAAWGAKVSFNRTVTRNGEQIIKETWRSSYRPWQAVYLVGTKE